MNLIIHRPNKHTLPIRTPTNRRHRTPNLKRRNRHLTHRPSIPITPFPNLDTPIIRTSHHQFRPSPTSHRPIHRINNLPMRPNLFNPLPSTHVHKRQQMIRRNSIHRRTTQRPSQIQNRRLCQVPQQRIVRIGRIRPPERNTSICGTRSNVLACRVETTT